jgi:type I restriction enzyme S subunit
MTEAQNEKRLELLSMKSEWKIINASEYCKNVADGTHDSPKQTETGKYIITSKHLGEYELDFANAYKISLEDYKKVIARSKVEQWDILFSMIGTIGRVYQETNAKTDYAIKNVGLFRLGGDKQKSNWLKYYLKSPKAQEYIQSRLRGSTQGYIPLEALRDMPVDVPPLPEQLTIATILSCLDNKISHNKKINHHLTGTMPETDSSPVIKRGSKESRRVARRIDSFVLFRMAS